MLKTVKSKVAAGTAAAVLFTGAGAAFASSDAGAKLKAWYDAQFNSTSQSIEDTTTATQTRGINGFTNYSHGLEAGAITLVNSAATQQTNEKTRNINKEKQEHIDAVNNKKAEIDALIDSQFKGLQDAALERLKKASDDAWSNASSTMTSNVNDGGLKANERLQNDLNATAKNAKDELTKAIADAKSDLLSQLDTKSKATTAEINKAINLKIAELNIKITLLATKLTADNTKTIINTANSISNQAKADMKKIVDGI